MNRRTFIHTFLISAGAVSAAGSQLWHREPRGLSLAFKHQPKLKMPVELSCAEQNIAALFASSSRSLYLFGGPVLARLENTESSWTNFLIDTPDFRRVKRDLFELGVEPISTPEMPGTFIKFLYQDRIYNVMNCEIDEFCQRNRVQAKVKLVPFAHNFMIYDCMAGELADPCDALKGRKNGKPEIQLVARPRSVVEGFDCVLSGKFESHLLGFSKSGELLDFEEFILNSPGCPSADQPRIVERTINYIPDAIETFGVDAAAAIARAPFVKSVLQSSLGVDMDKVWVGLTHEAPEDRSIAFLGLVKEQMGVDRAATGFEDRLTLYLATNGYALRRSDLALQVVMTA